MSAAQLGVEIDNKEYHRIEGVSHSGLKVFRYEPRDYHWRYVLGNHDRERKDYFDFGSAVHELALLGDQSNIKLIPDEVLSSSGSKAGKAWKEFESEHRDCLLLKPQEFYAVKRCVDAVLAHPMAGKLLACDGPVEQMFRFDDEQRGLTLKCKPDKLAVTPHGTIVVDLKTTENVNPGAFARAVVSYDYDFQRYFYEKILRKVGFDVIEFVFIAVSKSQPHCVSCFSIADEDMATAAVMTENALDDLGRRYQEDDWNPPNHDKITKLSLPRYAQNRSDYQL